MRPLRLYRPVRTRTPYNMVYPFERTVITNQQLNASSGWFTRGPGISFSFSLSELYVVYGNGTSGTTQVPGETDFTNLFDQYRIDRVDMEIYYSASNNQTQVATTNAQTTLPLPILNVVNDFDNRAVGSTVNLLEYPQCRSHQLGDVKPFRHTIWSPAGSVSGETVDGQALSGTKRRCWWDTSFPDVIHNCIKVSYQDFGSGTIDYSPDAIIGVAQFRFRIYYSFRNPK